jgi:hypothetical protein
LRFWGVAGLELAASPLKRRGTFLFGVIAVRLCDRAFTDSAYQDCRIVALLQQFVKRFRSQILGML